MNNNEIMIARERFNALCSLKDELASIQTGQDVKKYIGLVSSLLGFDLNKRCDSIDVVLQSFKGFPEREEDSNHLYVNVGKEEYGKGYKFHNVYKDLETGKKLLIYNTEWFEKEHLVLRPDVSLVGNIKDDNVCLNQAYESLRMEFYKGLLQDSQEKVVSGLIKKYGVKK